MVSYGNGKIETQNGWFYFVIEVEINEKYIYHENIDLGENSIHSILCKM